MKANMESRKEDTPVARERRKKLREAIAYKVYEFDAHGVEMNQRYTSDAVVPDGSPAPAFTEDPELYHQATTWPGARLPHVWLEKDRRAISSLDLVGQGRFTLLTSIGGEGWAKGTEAVSKELGVPIRVVTVGPGCNIEDPFGYWAAAREVEDDGCILVRPDQHVAWRSTSAVADPVGALRKVMTSILGV